jgi:hypothetical protein
MASIVYSLCALASIFVAYLLARAYKTKPSRIIFWSAICFAGLALNNIVLFIDLVVFAEEVTYGLIRNVIIVGSVSSLVYGLVWDTL